MDEKHRVILFSLFKTENYFKEKMVSLGVSGKAVDEIIDKAPVILKEGLSQGAVISYAKAIRLAGGRVGIQKYFPSRKVQDESVSLYIEPLENFTMCPQCGFKQLKVQSCSKCGLPL